MLTLLALCMSFGTLSLLAFGGGSAMLPEMARMCVAHGWASGDDFTLLYNLGQLAPGPNCMMVLTIGHKVAGIPGAIAVLVGFFLPPALLAYLLGRTYCHFRNSPNQEWFRRAMAPISVGLTLAGVHLMATSALHQFGSLLIFALAMLGLHRYQRCHPFFMVVLGGLLGMSLL
ncbi:MAG: chromate transporter [Candidatus Eremiobacteraeota bacterium]|nr:chromate transporter [Candidatus Eremiobacteraeota bacterium]MCW5871697.1 chromate transporter [Candidatus Eremiobacteraeota bacterium]